MTLSRYIKAPWPEGAAPAEEPSWFLYEIDSAADAVIRSVWLYADGRITRNSLEIEARGGDALPSLIDCSLAQGFAGVDLRPISADEFVEAWNRGVDTPFWNLG